MPLLSSSLSSFDSRFASLPRDDSEAETATGENESTSDDSFIIFAKKKQLKPKDTLLSSQTDFLIVYFFETEKMCACCFVMCSFVLVIPTYKLACDEC